VPGIKINKIEMKEIMEKKKSPKVTKKKKIYDESVLSLESPFLENQES